MEERKVPYGALIKQLSMAINKQADAALQENDLTFTQMVFLGALDQLPEGEAPLKELERRFRVAQSTAAGIAARLERKRLLESVPDEKDRRVKRVRITSAGRETFRRALDTIEAGEKQMLSPLTVPEQETLMILLTKINDSLRETEGGYCPCP